MQGRQIISEFVDQGKVLFVYRHLAFLGPESLRAAEASECAADQGRFWEYHDMLFENWAGENQGAFSDPNLARFANDVGLDVADFDECMASGRNVSRVQQDIDAARKAKIGSTPTIIINTVSISGLREYDTYRSIIEQELVKATQ